MTRLRLLMSAAIISHFVSVSSICTRSFCRQSRSLNFGSTASRAYSASQFSLRQRPDDFIEAEIISQKDGEKNVNNQKVEVTGMGLDRREKKEEGSGLFDKLTSFFGQDEKSLKKKAQKKQLNTAIDKVCCFLCLCCDIIAVIIRLFVVIMTLVMIDLIIDINITIHIMINIIELRCSRVLVF